MDNDFIKQRCRIIFWVLISLLILALSSCYTKKQAINKFGCQTIKDSTHVDTIWLERKVFIKLPGDSIRITVASPCDSNGKVLPFKKELKGSNGRVNGILESDTATNTITATCFEKEYQDTLIAKDLIIKAYREKVIKDSFEEPLPLKDQIKNRIFTFVIDVSIFVGLYFLIRLLIKKLS